MSVASRRGPRRVDVVAARDVLLQHVVLDRAAELLGRDALLLGDRSYMQRAGCGGRVDRHRGRDLVERDLVEEIRMSSSVSIGDARAPTSPSQSGSSESRPSCVGRSKATRDRSFRARAGSGSGRWFPPGWRSRRTAASSRGGRGTCSSWMPRVNGYAPGSPRRSSTRSDVGLVVERGRSRSPSRVISRARRLTLPGRRNGGDRPRPRPSPPHRAPLSLGRVAIAHKDRCRGRRGEVGGWWWCWSGLGRGAGLLIVAGALAAAPLAPAPASGARREGVLTTPNPVRRSPLHGGVRPRRPGRRTP